MDSQAPAISDRYTDAEVAEFRDRGWWRDETFTSLLDGWADADPDAVFLTDATRSLTFAELRGEASRLAAALRARGLGHGDRILMQLPNWAEFAITAAAASRVGAVIVPVMPIYRTDEVRYILQHSGAKIAVCPGEFRGFDYLAMFRELRADATDLQTVLVVRGEPGPDEVAFTSLSQPDRGIELPPADALGEAASADDGHIIIYTSGTESRPKGCYHTFNTLAFSVRTMQQLEEWTRDDVAFGPSPIGHATGYMTSILLPLRAGAATHLMDAWEPGEALRRIAEYRCTITTTATPFLRMLLDAYDPDVHDPSSMRAWIAAGAPIPETVVRDAEEALPTCEVLSLYGRSENMLTTMCPLGTDIAHVVSSDGREAEGIEVAVLGPDDAHLGTGEEGDLSYRGPGHMLGYYRNPEQTAAMMSPDGFSRSGDLGYRNEHGYIRVSGRAKDIIIRGGMNISAREIEEHLLAHPDVRDVAVVAMPDDRLGEKVCAFVVPAEGSALTLDGLTTFLRGERGIATQKLPERLEVMDALPTTATGKVQKFRLRSQAKEAVEFEQAGSAG